MEKMKEKLMKHLAKKGKKLEPLEKEAKMSVLSDLKNFAQEKMGEKLKDGIKKVTVASSDDEGLKEGLEKAKELLGSEEKEEDCEEEQEEMEKEPQNEDEIDAKIKELLALKEKLKMSDKKEE